MEKSRIAKLAQLIKTYTSERDITPREFAIRADVSPSYVYKILKNEEFSPTIDMLTKISKAMGMELGQLLRVCQFIETSKPQEYFSTTELINQIPDKYKSLFKGHNEQYLQFAQKLLASDVDPAEIEIVLQAYLQLKGE